MGTLPTPTAARRPPPTHLRRRTTPTGYVVSPRSPQRARETSRTRFVTWRRASRVRGGFANVRHGAEQPRRDTASMDGHTTAHAMPNTSPTSIPTRHARRATPAHRRRASTTPGNLTQPQMFRNPIGVRVQTPPRVPHTHPLPPRHTRATPERHRPHHDATDPPQPLRPLVVPHPTTSSRSQGGRPTASGGVCSPSPNSPTRGTCWSMSRTWNTAGRPGRAWASSPVPAPRAIGGGPDAGNRSIRTEPEPVGVRRVTRPGRRQPGNQG